MVASDIRVRRGVDKVLNGRFGSVTRLWSANKMGSYFASLMGASLTSSFVVASEERERQSWMVRTTQS